MASNHHESTITTSSQQVVADGAQRVEPRRSVVPERAAHGAGRQHSVSKACVPEPWLPQFKRCRTKSGGSGAGAPFRTSPAKPQRQGQRTRDLFSCLRKTVASTAGQRLSA